MGKESRFLIGVALLCCWMVAANADYMLYKDHRQPVDRRIMDLLSRMTLEEKIGQMVQIERQAASAEVMKKYYIGRSAFFKEITFLFAVLCLIEQNSCFLSSNANVGVYDISLE